MLNAVMSVTDLDQAVVPTPAVAVNDALGTHATAYNGLKRTFAAIEHDLGVDFAVAFEYAKDDCFTQGASTSFARGATCAEVRLIDLYFSLKRRSVLALLGQTLAQKFVDAIDRVAI